MSEQTFYPNADADDFEALDTQAYDIAKGNRALVMLALRNVGVGMVRINFSGGGDDGQIDDDIEFQGLTTDPKSVEVQKIKAQREQHYFDEGKMVRIKKGETIPQSGNLHTMLMEFADDIVGDRFPFDWCNNEGGSGTIEIRPGERNKDGTDGTITVLFNQNISSTEQYKLAC